MPAQGDTQLNRGHFIPETNLLAKQQSDQRRILGWQARHDGAGVVHATMKVPRQFPQIEPENASSLAAESPADLRAVTPVEP